jgi:hypothetical protein
MKYDNYDHLATVTIHQPLDPDQAEYVRDQLYHIADQLLHNGKMKEIVIRG